MGYSNEQDVREEAGGIFEEEDLDTDDVTEAIAAADVIINNSTQHVWSPTDASYGLVVIISKLFASSFVMSRFDDPKKEGEANFQRAKELLEILMMGDEITGDINIAVTDHKTFPLNPNAPITRGRLTLSTINEEIVDPDRIYEDGL